MNKENNPLLKPLAAFAKYLATVILPYIFGTMAVFTAGLFVLWKFGIEPSGLHRVFKIILLLLACVFYFPFSFLYGCFMAALSALRGGASLLEETVKDFLSRLQKTLDKKVDNMKEGLPKKQAKVILNAGIKDVVKTYKENKTGSAGAALAVFILSFLVISVRRTLFGTIKKSSGANISLGTLFAGKAVLAGAVIFNLKLLCTILLVLGYIFGLIILGAQFILIL